MTPIRGMLLAAVLAAASFSLACTGDVKTSKGIMSSINKQSLVGVWRKNTQAPCASRYPEWLEFRVEGVYEAPDGPATGAYWHGGEWLIGNDGQVVIQMANDAMVAYRIVDISALDMILQDSEGCRIGYRRDSR